MGTLYPTHKPGLGLHYGKYTNGIPEAGVPASVVDADHLNLLTDNIEETIKTAGLDPSHATTDVNQLKKALLWAAGIWQAGTDYPEGATVLQDGTRYIAARAHTASGTNTPGQSGAPWESVDYRSFNKLYPVGSLYFNYSSLLNPADAGLLGFGTWIGLEDGYTPAQVGVNYELGILYPDQIQGHYHTGLFRGSDGYPMRHLDSTPRGGGDDGVESGGNGSSLYVGHPLSDDRSGVVRVGSETRGKRVGVYIWCRLA